MPYSAKPNSRYAAHRPVIGALIRALCAVPKEARKEWANELMKVNNGIEVLPPDELVVRQVLINLDVAEDVASARREEMKPKLYPIVGREIARRGTSRAGKKAAPPDRRDAGEPPRAG